MSKIKTLLLDYDGTISETRPAILIALHDAFSKMGIEIAEPSFLEKQLGRGGTLQEFYYSVKKGATEEEARRFVSFYRAAYQEADDKETYLFPKVPQTLEKLSFMGFDLMIVSNKHGPTLEKSLKFFQLDHFIKASYGSYEMLARKPSPLVWHARLLKDFPDLKIEETLIVGDTVADLNFANALKMKACWAEYGHGLKEQCLALKPAYKITSFSELPLIFER